MAALAPKLATVARMHGKATGGASRIPNQHQKSVHYNDHVEFLAAMPSTAARRRRRRLAAGKHKLAALTAAAFLAGSEIKMQPVREPDTDVIQRLAKLENLFLLYNWHASQNAVAHDDTSTPEVDPVLAAQHSCQAECEASPERQSALQNRGLRMLEQTAIPPLPMGGPPGLPLSDSLQPTYVTAKDEKAIKPSEVKDAHAIQVANIDEAQQKIIDQLQLQVNELSQRSAADDVHKLQAEIDTLLLTMPEAHDAHATQLELLTEE